MEKDIGKILKGEYQGNITEIIIAIREFNGRVGVDIREYSKSERYTGPTKKGLRIPAESFEEFKTMINSIKTSDLVSDGASSSSGTKNKSPSKTNSELSDDEYL